MRNYLDIIVENIQSFIDSKEQSDAWLAKKADINRSVLNRLISSGGSPNLETLLKISNGMGVYPWVLFIDRNAEDSLSVILRRLPALNQDQLGRLTELLDDIAPEVTQVVSAKESL